LRLGTWNVLSLYRPGASNILKQELEKVRMDLLALQASGKDKPHMDGWSDERCRGVGNQELED